MFIEPCVLDCNLTKFQADLNFADLRNTEFLTNVSMCAIVFLPTTFCRCEEVKQRVHDGLTHAVIDATYSLSMANRVSTQTRIVMPSTGQSAYRRLVIPLQYDVYGLDSGSSAARRGRCKNWRGTRLPTVTVMRFWVHDDIFTWILGEYLGTFVQLHVFSN